MIHQTLKQETGKDDVYTDGVLLSDKLLQLGTRKHY